jgi:hypothetical protein
MPTWPNIPGCWSLLLSEQLAAMARISPTSC